MLEQELGTSALYTEIKKFTQIKSYVVFLKEEKSGDPGEKPLGAD